VVRQDVRVKGSAATLVRGLEAANGAGLAYAHPRPANTAELKAAIVKSDSLYDILRSHEVELKARSVMLAGHQRDRFGKKLSTRCAKARPRAASLAG
jgi:hypothetical protein